MQVPVPPMWITSSGIPRPIRVPVMPRAVLPAAPLSAARMGPAAMSGPKPGMAKSQSIPASRRHRPAYPLIRTRGCTFGCFGMLCVCKIFRACFVYDNRAPASRAICNMLAKCIGILRRSYRGGEKMHPTRATCRPQMERRAPHPPLETRPALMRLVD